VSELTLGGYMALHGRAAAFGGSDGQAYSVGLVSDEEPDERGLYGAGLLFVCWSPAGTEPVGHLEAPHLARGRTPEEAIERLKLLSLFDVKAALDQAVATRPPEW
jgi:hypothetical protein